MSTRRRRFTLVISSLQAGGAERVLSRMANYWAARGHDVEIVSLDLPGSVPFYPLHRDVRIRELGLLRDSRHKLDAVWSSLGRVRQVRRAIKRHRPDAVISFVDQVNVVTLLATRGLGIPVIVSERVDPAQVTLPAPWPRLRLWTYPWARQVVVQTRQAAAYFHDPRIRTTVIGNPIAPAPATDRSGLPAANAGGDGEDGGDGVAWITAIGRLTPQKGFDLLLRAFAEIAAAHPRWSLRIIGEGNERQALVEQARTLGLADRVQFTGRVADVFPLLAAADLFVLSSRFEGFPNALGEAMAAGLPVIAFDCPSGPADLIRHEVDGLLAPPEDVAALARAMDRLIANPAERAALAARAIDVVDRFSEAAIMERWEALLEA